MAEEPEVTGRLDQVFDAFRKFTADAPSPEGPDLEPLASPDPVAIPDIRSFFQGVGKEAPKQLNRTQRVFQKIGQFVEKIDPELSKQKEEREKTLRLEKQEKFMNGLRAYETSLRRTSLLQHQEDNRVRVLNEGIRERNKIIEQAHRDGQPLTNKEILKVYGSSLIGPIIRQQLGLTENKRVLKKKDATEKDSKEFAARVLSGEEFPQAVSNKLRRLAEAGGKTIGPQNVDPLTEEGKAFIQEQILSPGFLARAAAAGADLRQVMPILRQAYPGLPPDEHFTKDAPVFIDPGEEGQGMTDAAGNEVVTGPDGKTLVPTRSTTLAVPQITSGNIDLFKQSKVKSEDGLTNTILSVSFNEGGKEILVPRVSPDGRTLSDQEAFALYKRTGKHLGIFKDEDSATAYAIQLHKDFEAGKFKQGKATGRTTQSLFKYNATDADGHPTIEANEPIEDFEARLYSHPDIDINTATAINLIAMAATREELMQELSNPVAEVAYAQMGMDVNVIRKIVIDKYNNARNSGAR